jgi:hypothetical protein
MLYSEKSGNPAHSGQKKLPKMLQRFDDANIWAYAKRAVCPDLAIWGKLL